MLNLDKIVGNKNISKNWPFRMIIIGPSRSGKTNALLHLIKNLNNTNPIDKIYLCAKDLNEPKYKFLINNRENVGIKHFNDPAAFIEHLSDMNDIFTNINNYNVNKKRRILMIFDDMIADISRSKNFKAIVKELFIRCRKLNTTQSYFRTPKDARQNSTHFLIMKIRSRKELKNIAEKNSGDVDFKDFLKIYNECTGEPYSFMIIDTMTSGDGAMRFSNNFDAFYKHD